MNILAMGGGENGRPGKPYEIKKFDEEIKEETAIAGQSGIMNTIKEEGKTWMGSPAFHLRDYLRSYAVFKRAGK